jgi:hypothetical protein
VRQEIGVADGHVKFGRELAELLKCWKPDGTEWHGGPPCWVNSENDYRLLPPKHQQHAAVSPSRCATQDGARNNRRNLDMRRFALATMTAIAMVLGAATLASAAPVSHQHGPNGPVAPDVRPQKVDYYWNHHRYHHRDWDREHHHWHYYD